MNPTQKSTFIQGSLSVLLSIICQSPLYMGLFNVSRSSPFLIKVLLPFILSIIAIVLGFTARKGSAKILGLIGIVLGIVAVLSYLAYFSAKV